MKFIVLILALLLQRLFGLHAHEQHDRWLAGYQRLLQRYMPRGVVSPEGLFLWLVILPSVLVSLLINAVSGWLFGLVGLLLNLLVLLYAMGRVHHDRLLDRYLYAWRAGDLQAAYHWAEKLLQQKEPLAVDDSQALHRQVRRFWLYNSFTQLFSVLFWFVLLGPAGALLVRLTDLFLHRLERPHSAERVKRFLYFLEWVPVRLLGLTFALAGNFVISIRQWMQDGLRRELGTAMLLDRLALAGIGKFTSGFDVHDPYQGEAPGFFTLSAEGELLALRDLLTRALVVWIILFALWVIIV